VDKLRGIIGLSRDIGFFTTGYDYVIQLVPLVIVAPLVIHGDLEFGMLAQGQMAFFLVMGAFSVIVKEFQRISTFGAVIERLGVFVEALGDATTDSPKSPLECSEDPGRARAGSPVRRWATCCSCRNSRTCAAARCAPRSFTGSTGPIARTTRPMPSCGRLALTRCRQGSPVSTRWPTGGTCFPSASSSG
jgi:hypothetical protein